MKVVRININGSMNDITVDLKSKNYSKVLEKNSISPSEIIRLLVEPKSNWILSEPFSFK